MYLKNHQSTTFKSNKVNKVFLLKGYHIDDIRRGGGRKPKGRRKETKAFLAGGLGCKKG
jgi:hypothetical protein